jgi:hypothetical protein
VPDRNEVKFQLNGIQPSADHSFIPTVVFILQKMLTDVSIDRKLKEI